MTDTKTTESQEGESTKFESTPNIGIEKETYGIEPKHLSTQKDDKKCKEGLMGSSLPMTQLNFKMSHEQT